MADDLFVGGVTTGKVLPLTELTNLPPMKRRVSMMEASSSTDMVAGLGGGAGRC